MQSGYVTANGVKLYYEIAGTGKPLVFIHGFGVDRRMWDAQFTEFAEQYQVIRYDVRGFGKSDLPGCEPFSNVEDLKGLLDALHLDRVTLIGLSMGGIIAIDFALAYPERLEALVLADSGLEGFVPHVDEAQQKSFFAIVQAAMRGDLVEASEVYLHTAVFKLCLTQPEVEAKIREMLKDYSFWHYKNQPNTIKATVPAITRLEEITLPVLTVLGIEDLPDFHEVADLFVEKMANARKVVIPDADHMSNMTNPAFFNAAVKEFLNVIE